MKDCYGHVVHVGDYIAVSQNNRVYLGQVTSIESRQVDDPVSHREYETVWYRIRKHNDRSYICRVTSPTRVMVLQAQLLSS